MAGVVSPGLMLSQIQGPPCIWGWLIFPIQHIVYLAVRWWFTHALPHPDTGCFLDSIVFCVYWPWSSAGLDWYDITAPFARIIAGVCRLVGLLCFVVLFFPPQSLLALPVIWFWNTKEHGVGPGLLIASVECKKKSTRKESTSTESTFGDKPQK